jgi:hypothetical protein
MTNQLLFKTRPSTRDWGLQLKTFLTTVMSLLSLLVVLLGGSAGDGDVSDELHQDCDNAPGSCDPAIQKSDQDNPTPKKN